MFWFALAVASLVVIGTVAALLWPREAGPPPERPAAESSTITSLSSASNSVALVTELASKPNVTNDIPAELRTPLEFETLDVDKASELLNRGTELLGQGKISEAIELYQTAIKLNPEDEDAHYNLAIALGRHGQHDAAIKEYQEALRIYPDYTEAHINLGNLLVARKQIPEAIQHFREALKIAPDSASAHNNLGNALGREGNLDAAIDSFKEAVRLKPDYIEARFNLANSYLAKLRPAEAEAEFSEILRLKPDFELARLGLQRAQQLKAGQASQTK